MEQTNHQRVYATHHRGSVLVSKMSQGYSVTNVNQDIGTLLVAEDVSLANVTKKDHSKRNAIRLVFKIYFWLVFSVYRLYPFRPGEGDLVYVAEGMCIPCGYRFVSFSKPVIERGNFPRAGCYKGSLVRESYVVIVSKVDVLEYSLTNLLKPRLSFLGKSSRTR